MKLRRRASLPDNPGARRHLQPFSLSSLVLFSGCCFIYTAHHGWVVGCQAPSISWTITREIMFSCYPLCLVTSPLLPRLWIRAGRLVFSIVFIFVSSLVSTTLVFWQLRLKYSRAVFMCVWHVINGVRGVYFHFFGGKYDCLRCHCPLTCPAGWKGFLTHPSHASALQSIRGAGQTQGRLGIWISHPHINQTVISAGNLHLL